MNITNWVKYTVGELVERGEAEIKTGPFGTQLHASDYVDSGTPVINVRNIGLGSIRDEKLEYIAKETLSRLSSHLLRYEDIVFGRKGAVERHAYIRRSENGWFQGSDCIRLRVNSKTLIPKFLSYCLLTERHKQWMMNQCSHGATMASLNQSIIRRIPVFLPPLPIQRKIASILSAYDDLIENNLRRIKILEEMAQNLYREWFVKFRFPGHESIRMVNSPLGKIPEGWEVKAFTEIADVLSGGTPKTSKPEFWNGPIPFFAPKDSPSSFYVTDTEKSITELGLTKCNSKLYSKNTVFITARGTVGKVEMPSRDMAINQSCYALKGRNNISQYFIFLMVLDQVDYLKKNTGGATFDTIIVDTFRRMMITKPPKEIIDVFTGYVDPFFSGVLNLIQKNEILHENRDLLLPRLISGELDVSDLDIEIPEDAA